MALGTIDRFEGAFAVLEVEGREQKAARSALPKDAREGDVIDLTTMTVDRAATEALRRETEAANERANVNVQKPGNFDL